MLSRTVRFFSIYICWKVNPISSRCRSASSLSPIVVIFFPQNKTSPDVMLSIPDTVQQENYSRYQNRTGSIDKTVIAAVYYNRLRGIIYKHFPERVTEHQANARANNGNSEIFCKVQSPNFYVSYAYCFHNAYLAEFPGEGKDYDEPRIYD